MTPQQVEKLETLDGSRRKEARRRAAVRVEDLAALLQVPPALKATKSTGAAPTKAEFDALVDDVTLLHARLKAVADALQARIL